MGKTTAKTQIVQARVTPQLKRDAEHVLDKIGISTTDAFRMFLRQVVLQKGLPFEAKVPNKATIAAFREDVNKLKSYTSTEEMFKDILGKNWRTREKKKYA
ncbi:type II toxin-antitoxin system RelB/DinJ family antitoxin [Candidatus Kaiserbacteria bacterium]|nr:type II toxin-antitoxin system RelB/DinJ family antitoxin [Candidatus Kaiserbacteria bacterium]